MKKKLLSMLLLALIISTFTTAQTIWNGPTITFTKAANADWTQPANQDRITASTWLTRATTRGLFNIFSETVYNNFVSPANTEWASGTLANYASLTYDTWENWAGSTPPSTVGVPAVLHLVAENIYIGITFLSWGVGAGGGGSFSYQRTTANISTPVKLVSFTATRKTNSIQLNWKTSSEENTSFFAIERSSDGKQFSSIGTLAASGNSDREKTYSFADLSPLPASFYRLKTNDVNGAISYSHVVAVKMGKQKPLEIFPVPANDILHVQLATVKPSEMQIIDALGRTRKCISLASGENAFTLDIKDLKAGIYFLRTGQESKMFIKN